MLSGQIIDGPYNVRPKSPGEYFVAQNGLLPRWFPGKFENAPENVVIHIDINGIATMRRSLSKHK